MFLSDAVGVQSRDGPGQGDVVVVVVDIVVVVVAVLEWYNEEVLIIFHLRFLFVGRILIAPSTYGAYFPLPNVFKQQNPPRNVCQITLLQHLFKINGFLIAFPLINSRDSDCLRNLYLSVCLFINPVPTGNETQKKMK